jgi:hypothetical protein
MYLTLANARAFKRPILDQSSICLPEIDDVDAHTPIRPEESVMRSVVSPEGRGLLVLAGFAVS